MEETKPVQLSKNLLEMKFMKRTKERVQKEAQDAQGQLMYSKEITEEMKKSGNIVFSECSIFNCKDLVEGRLSFKGMNPELEKLMSYEYVKKVEQMEKKKEMDVSDAQMAEGYSSLVNTVSNKFKNKKPKNKYKGHFLKPAD